MARPSHLVNYAYVPLRKETVQIAEYRGKLILSMNLISGLIQLFYRK